MNPQMWINAQIAVALWVGCAAVIDDLFRRRISNWIPTIAFVSGIGIQILERGWRGGISAIGGAFAGAVMFLAFYLLGGMGGGDIKLMAGFGALLGASRVLEAVLWTAICGGVIAAGWITITALHRRYLDAGSRAKIQCPVYKGPVQSIPYAPAIALGSWLSLISNIPNARGLL